VAAAALPAGVVLTRCWAWHFAKPLVDTPSDFGAQGEKPTHPELLDDLAARFVASGWALKWRDRGINLSPAHRGQRVVAQVAAPRDHALRGLPAGQPPAARRRQGRSRQPAALADEPAPP